MNRYDQGYRGSQSLKRVNTPIQWTPELVEEYIKCSQDPMYFAEQHMYIVNVDRGKIKIQLYDYQREIIQSALDNRRTVAECARQSGKALCIETDIPTINGWKKMKDIVVGDTVFDMHGQPTRVVFKSETHNKSTYKITFSDNTTVDCCEDHLWQVYDAQKKDQFLTIATKDLVANGLKKFRSKIENRYSIPLSEPVEYNGSVLPIDPYVLGLWLGDGLTASGRIVMLEQDFNSIKHLIPYEYSISRYDQKNQNILYVRIHGLTTLLSNQRLLSKKHIPQIYLTASVNNRMQLLRGLMDTDGYVGKSMCGLTQSLKHSILLDDVKLLINSLGLKFSTYQYLKHRHPSETIRFSAPFYVFELARKKQKQTIPYQKKCTRRYIINIEQIETKPTQCIQVESNTHTYLCTKNYIVTHNTTAITVFVLWYILFNKDKTVAILANRGETAREILSRIMTAYEMLPKWLQQGVVEWNKGKFELENGSRVLAAATTSTNIRGYAINMLIIDEAAFIEGWEDFFTSVFPTITSGVTTKVCLISTVNGLNHFWEITKLARCKDTDPDNWNGYHLISVPWTRVPGRGEQWYNETLQGLNFNHERFAQEYENRYLGSSGTLIAGWKLETMNPNLPLVENEGIKMWVKPQKHRQYIGVADVSRGKLLDYSTLQMIDITEMPYQQVLTYRSNQVTPGDFAEIINRIGRQYGACPIMVEINDIGQQTAETLYFDYEYENVLFTESAGKMGKRITQSYQTGKTDRGLRTTKTVKATGCSLLKLLIEQDQLLINDAETIYELSTFSRKNASYEAEEGKHDDLVMPLVLFGWITQTKYFKDTTDINTLVEMREKSDEYLMNELTPFGFIDDGVQETPRVEDGDAWFSTSRDTFYFER